MLIQTNPHTTLLKLLKTLSILNLLISQKKIKIKKIKIKKNKNQKNKKDTITIDAIFPMLLVCVVFLL